MLLSELSDLKEYEQLCALEGSLLVDYNHLSFEAEKIPEVVISNLCISFSPRQVLAMTEKFTDEHIRAARLKLI